MIMNTRECRQTVEQLVKMLWLLREVDVEIGGEIIAWPLFRRIGLR